MQQLALFDNPDTPFEKIRRTDETGHEYWYARELMPLLEYTDWRNFKQVIRKAKTALKNNGQNTDNHVGVEVNKHLTKQGAEREVEDFRLSREACYLISLNGDPTKKAIADAQVYFVVQTRRQEISDEKKRLDKRKGDVTDYQLHGKSEGWANQRVESKASQKSLNATLKATHEDHKPNYGEISSVQNQELFGMTRRQIIEYLGLLPKDEDKYRDRLGFYALEALNSVNYTSMERMKTLHRPLTGDEQLSIVIHVVRLLAPTFQQLAAYAGQDYLSGATLNEHGHALINRNVKLLKG